MVNSLQVGLYIVENIRPPKLMLFLFSGGSPGQSICRFSGFGSVLGSSSSSVNAQGTGPNILYSDPNIL